MSAPVVWIVFPLLSAASLYLLRRLGRGAMLTGVILTALLAWLAWRLPINSVMTIGPWSIKLSDTLWILGRRLVLTDAERPYLTLIFLATSFWFGGALAVPTSPIYIPAGLAIASLMVASLAVDPFLYAALFIEIAAFLCIPLLALPAKPVGRGVLRFISFQTLGTPFILFSGWLAANVQNNPAQPDFALRAALLAGLGFVFLLAMFPFHTWIPMLTDETHPYLAAFVFYMLPGILLLFALKFLSNNPWLTDLPLVSTLLRYSGVIMIAIGGIWAAFQRRLGRMLAYAMLAEIGLSFLAIDIHFAGKYLNQGETPFSIFFFALFISRGLALGTWAMALSVFSTCAPDLRFEQVRGLGRQYPIATCALIVAHFSLAGIPLLAGFPVRLSVIDSLATTHPLAAFWVLFGMAGLLAGALRTLIALTTGPEEGPWTMRENRLTRFFLLSGIGALILTGIFPMI